MNNEHEQVPSGTIQSLALHGLGAVNNRKDFPMFSKLSLIAAAACLPFALSSCGGGTASSAPASDEVPVSDEAPAADLLSWSTASSASEGTPPITDLLAWNHGRVSNWYWYHNSDLRPADDETETGLRLFEPDANGDFHPMQQDRASLAGLISMGGDTALGLRNSYVSWGDPVNGIGYLIGTESDEDYIRASSTYYNYFNFTDGVRRSITARWRYSAFLQYGTWLCRPSVGCESSGVRSAIWGKRVYTPGVPGDNGWRWLQRAGATASWRGAMAGSTVATGIALVGEAAVSYSVSDDSVGVELTNITQRDDGTGVVEATYSGPASFAWTLTGNPEDQHADYWGGDDDSSASVRFYGPNAEEAAGDFQTVIPDDRIVGGFVTTRQ